MQVGTIHQKVKKRVYSTPKDINQYLKDSKNGLSLRVIAEKLGFPKTQVEHYFRIDKSRAIPSPDIWLRLKDLLGLDSRYDKQVLDFYEKDMDYEMNQRVYGVNGECPTLKSGSSTYLEASEDSISDSKVQMIQLKRGYNKRSNKKVRITPPISSHSWEQNNLIVSGIATKTNTQFKPTTKTSKPSMNQQTSQQSNQKTSQTLICYVQDSLANLFQLLEKERVSKILEELCFMKYLESHQRKNLDCSFWKTSKGYLTTMKGERIKSFSNRFHNWGMMLNGKCLTVRILEYHRTGNGCSLSDILEEQIDNKYFLSEKAMDYLQRADDRGRLRINFQQQSHKTSKEEFIQEEKH